MGGWQKLGVSYPRGGPQKTALAMVEAIELRGGAVFVRAPVASLVLDPVSGAAKGVVLASGETLLAKQVVSALGYRATEALIAKQPPTMPPAPPPPPPPLQTAQSAGFVMANVALEGTMAQLGISSANVWIQPANAANAYDALEGEKRWAANDPLMNPIMTP